ncbi:MAG: glutamate-5-semialdehyde dehydrogenase [Lachnospiraceae bacterium]|nr:glutamate-5-semialdehyde dehydrogenase [Lachnospiraceae bacterium]
MLEVLGKKAVTAKFKLQVLTEEEKNKALLCAAQGLLDDREEILEANARDMRAGRENGMQEGLLDRLKLDADRIGAMAEGLRQVADLPDPVGKELEAWERPNGLHLKKISVPLGVIGIIYESRPNVTADAFALCFKAGNAVILKGGSDAIHSNGAITASLRKSLKKTGVIEDAVQLIGATDREITTAFMKCKNYIDVLIPRGSAGLIRAAVENSTIPIIETGTGNCHIYIDESANVTDSVNIVINAKTQRIGVCNACESLVIHEKIAGVFLSTLAQKIKQVHEVEIRGDEKVCEMLSDAVPATEEDYGREYLDYILSAVTVKNIDEAIAHINRYSTHHSDAIITENRENARKFSKEIDSACVYVNASTRFTDGFEFGFGAEIGISTQKLHARGPMGLPELTTYKYVIEGDGQIR